MFRRIMSGLTARIRRRRSRQRMTVVLRCPDCRSDTELVLEGGAVGNGGLSCPDCGREFRRAW